MRPHVPSTSSRAFFSDSSSSTSATASSLRRRRPNGFHFLFCLFGAAPKDRHTRARACEALSEIAAEHAVATGNDGYAIGK